MFPLPLYENSSFLEMDIIEKCLLQVLLHLWYKYVFCFILTHLRKVETHFRIFDMMLIFTVATSL